MKRLAFLLLMALPARAEETAAQIERDLRLFLVDGHLKLAQKCLTADLTEEARAEFRAVLAVDAANDTALTMTRAGGRSWVLSWDDARHSAFLDYRELRKILAYDASERFLKLGLAKKKAGDPFGAKAAWRRALDYDADYADAREQIGEVRVDGVGWMAKADADRRAKGLLPIGGRWLPAEEVRRRRSKWAEAWEVEGRHFLVKTNLSFEAGAEALAWAEDMYAALVRETAPVFAPPKVEPRYPVYLFATKEDYDAHGRDAHNGEIPRTAIGYYSSTDDRAAHFWHRDVAGGTPLRDIVRHECCHMVLDTWIRWEEEPTLRPHFWIYEGLARFFESAVSRDGKILVGDPKHPPFVYGRAMVSHGDGIPLAKLVSLVQRDMGDYYEEAAAATLFFMTAGDGEFREKFLKYCAVVLAGEAEAGTFTAVFGQGPEEFEAAFRRWAKDGK